jgi:hypothetical protein
VTDSGSTATRQNASTGAPSARTTAALMTPAWVTAMTEPSIESSQTPTRSHTSSRLSPPCGRAAGSVIQAFTASGSTPLISARVRPAQLPKSHSAIAGSITGASKPAAAAVSRQRRAGLHKHRSPGTTPRSAAAF